MGNGPDSAGRAPIPRPEQVADVASLNKHIEGDVKLPIFIELTSGRFVYVLYADLAEMLSAIELAKTRGQQRLAELLTDYSDWRRRTSGDLQEF